MVNTDADNFKLMINTLHALYGKREPANEVMRVWWIKLAKFEFNMISKAFDTWSDTKSIMPTPSDIIPLCQHKVTIYSRLPSPLAKEANKAHADEVVKFIAEHTVKTKDYHSWAKRIITRPHRFPKSSLEAARKLLGDYQPTEQDFKLYAS
jgi:hypothetical protein